MKPLTVAMVAACAFPANHGTPAAIREMSENLASRGHSIHVVTYPLKEDIPIERVRIHRVRKVGGNQMIAVGPGYRRLAFDALMIPKLCEVIRKYQVDIIHAHNYEGALVGYAAKKLTGIPLIYNAINTMISELPSYGFIRPQFMAVKLAELLDYVTPRMADFIFANTEELMSFIIGKGLPADCVKVISTGVQVEMFAKGDGNKVRDTFLIGGKPLVMYTGTFDQFQGLDYLFNAFKIVQDQYPEAVLLLVGSTVNPEHLVKYKSMARELRLENNVIFTTSSLDNLPDFLAAADVTVSPRPISMGMPVKLLNYMAAAKPSVSFEGSARFLRHRENALLVKSEDTLEFGKAVIQLIADKSLARQIGINARNSIEGNYDYKTLSKKIESLYNFVLEKQKRKSSK